jgi:hypothetical protein
VRFSSLIALVGMFCGVASVVFGVLTFRGETAYAVPCFVMAIACWLFIWISKAGSRL